ncbi:hypothetical protein LEP1GSC058_3314 [Leptospira fainei serovar Hurstbridge str. BUT 6]|uniref:Uncharacterized protein n=1 Tax=Leptospira fainei serovar Hurstbridge str. BUT 6 TaxID=1193011 RepID=S3UUP6_9LEPT|nr:hypothetical protein [Leptospira fainei]EPG74146.1 hypothetical protein LEP1GSC058_3314 [Leptospira fainei serovar Hurstbridge str. BUT 6]
MSKALLTAGAILLLSMPLYISAQVAGPPDEEKAKKELQVQWSKRFPGDKILNVESAGKPRLIERDSTEENAPPDVRYKFSFFLTSRKKEGQVTKTPVGVIFQFVRSKGWIFSDIGLARSVTITEAGKEPPSKEEAYQLIEDAINEDRGKVNKSIDSLRLSQPEFGQNATLNKEQFWFRYEGEYESTENGLKTICSEFVIRLVKEGNSIGWKVEWDDKGKCKPIDEQ